MRRGRQGPGSCCSISRMPLAVTPLRGWDPALTAGSLFPGRGNYMLCLPLSPQYADRRGHTISLPSSGILSVVGLSPHSADRIPKGIAHSSLSPSPIHTYGGGSKQRCRILRQGGSLPPCLCISSPLHRRGAEQSPCLGGCSLICAQSLGTSERERVIPSLSILPCLCGGRERSTYTWCLL